MSWHTIGAASLVVARTVGQRLRGVARALRKGLLRPSRTPTRAYIADQGRLRPMTERDLPAVLRIEKQCYETPWPGWFFRRVLRAGMSCWILESNSGEILGYGVMNLKKGWAHVMNLCVARAYRGRGIGKRILSHLLVVARQRKATRAWLEVRLTNQRAIRLYLHAGFRTMAIRKNYYTALRGSQDALLMMAHIAYRR